MSKSFIGIQNLDNSIQFVYCRDTDSEILFQYFNDEKSVRELISFGDISKLGKLIHPTGDTHTIERPEKDVCIFYHRDGGDDLEITIKNSLDEVKDFGQFDGFLYIYNLNKNNWDSYPKIKEEKWVTLGID
jgi:hypothetical protein